MCRNMNTKNFFILCSVLDWLNGEIGYNKKYRGASGIRSGSKVNKIFERNATNATNMSFLIADFCSA